MAAKTSISLNQITQAAERISSHAVRTPLLRHPALDEATDRHIYLKLENLQYTGSFKFRGAYNKLRVLADSAQQRPIVAWSSGNHAQGVAAAAKLCNMQAHIVMPSDAPEIKKRNTAGFGATIVEYDRFAESREDIGKQLAEELGAVIVAPYDDYDIMAGQGTAGLEAISQSQEWEGDLDAVLTCCGGGGLTAGVMSAFCGLSPSTARFAVEPEAFNDHQRSLEQGERQINPSNARSICDALLAPTPGELTFPINQHLLDGVFTVSDEEIVQTIKFAYNTLKLVIEPGGAAALAAVLHDKVPAKYKDIAVIVTGGNVDQEQFTTYLTQA